MKYLLAFTSLLLAPLAQAQSWAHLLGDAPGQSTSLAITRALDNSADGNLHVQTTSVAGNGATTGRLYTLDSSGALLPLTTAAVPSSGAVLQARSLSARDGYRVSVYEQSRPGETQPSIYFYQPGQAVHQRFTNFILGIKVDFLTSNGNNGALIVYHDPQGRIPFVTLWTSPQSNGWWHTTGGCPTSQYDRVTVLAADYEPAPVSRLTVTTRCDGTPAQGGGRITVQSFDPASGALIGSRHSWPYADSDAPVIGARAIGQGRFVIEQADSVTGEHVARVISIDGEEDRLAMPGDFRLQDVVRFPGGALIPTVDEVRKHIGALVFDAQRNDWLELPELDDLARTELAWGATAAGSMVVAYQQVQADQHSLVRLRVMDNSGRVVGKRGIDTYRARAPGRIELRGLADGSEALLLAADVEKADGSGAVYVEQFVPEGDGIGEIEVPVIDIPRH